MPPTPRLKLHPDEPALPRRNHPFAPLDGFPPVQWFLFIGPYTQEKRMSCPEDAHFDELLHRFNDGDEEAAAQLVHHYYDEMRASARWQLKRYPLLRRIKDSTDFTQDACASVFRMFHEGCTFDTKEELIAFWKAIARNKVKKGARQYLTAAKRDLRRQQSLDGAAPLADPAPGPTETAANDELIKQAIQSLNPLDRTISRMIWVEQRSCREIAAALQYDEPTIQRWLRQITKQMAQLCL